MSKPIIVTGAAGLIGFAVASKLALGGHSVIGTDILPPQDHNTFPYFQADLRDAHALYPLLKNGALGIIHCGGISGPMLFENQPHTIVSINIIGTANVLEAARIYDLRRVIYCSSTSAYGNTPLGLELIDENIALNAVDVYGASKASGDILTRAYADQHSLDTVALRFSWVYGPRRRTECILRQMIQNTRDGKSSCFNFGTNFTRQYIHIDDVVRATLAAWNKDELSQHAYNITGNSSLNFEEIADSIRSILPGADIHNLGSDNTGDLNHGTFDTSAASKDFGYTPSKTFVSGVKQYAKWLEKNKF